MPYVKTPEGDIEITEEFLETCPRCGGTGKYQYFPYANKLVALFHRLTGATRCIRCKGSGKTLTEHGRALVDRKVAEAMFARLKEEDRSKEKSS